MTTTAHPVAPPAMERHIQGLRGLAVALVVAYHLRVGGFGGGGFGVDVFFVISGYVIASSLLAELDRTGSIRLRDFFARRVRRLLPVLAVVVVVTLVTYWIGWDEALRNTFRGQALAGTFGAANLWSAYRQLPYNGFQEVLISPFTHLWSLGVEEQFYLVVAPAFVLIARMRVPRIPVRRLLLIASVVVGIGSILLSVVYGHSERPRYAFYLPDARAWELVAGVVLALTRARWSSLRTVVATVACWVGIGTIAAMVVTQTVADDRLTAGPAMAVVGASLVIIGGHGSSWWHGGRALSVRPMTALGSIAYPLYLWHWPVFAIVADRFVANHFQRIGTLVVSLALAVVTHVAVERPLRWSKFLVARPRTTIVGGVAVSLALLLLASAATSARPLAERLPVSPSLDLLIGPADYPQPPCTGRFPERVDICGHGDPEGDRTIMLIGDSHAQFWLDTLDEAGQRNHWRIVAEFASGCPWVDLDAPDGSFLDRSCTGIRERTIGTMRDFTPDLVVATSHYAAQMAGISEERYTSAAVETYARFPPGTKLLILGDVPGLPSGSGRCLIDHIDDTDACAFDRSEGIDDLTTGIVERTAERLGASYAASAPWVCPEERCRIVRDGYLLYRDGDHLTTEFSRTLAPQLGEVVSRVMSR